MLSEIRPFTIRSGDLKLPLQVPQSLLADAEPYREIQAFSSELDMTVYLLEKLVQQDAPLLSYVFAYFESKILKGTNVHSLVQDLDRDTQQHILCVYYEAATKLGVQPTDSVLIKNVLGKKAHLFAIFGGQGNVEAYFEELQFAYQAYKPLVRAFLLKCSRTLAAHSESNEAIELHVSPIRLMDWLEDILKPSNEQLLATHLSLPLIGLTQLLHYYVLLKLTGKKPSDWISLLEGTTGHSQGVISSVVIASAQTDQDFADLTQKALGLLFWIGLRSEKAFPTTSISSRVIQDSIANAEGMPTPMLAINGLSVAEATEHLQNTNSFLPPDRQIQVALVNGPRSIICSGHPQSLYGLNVALRRLKADPAQDQTRLPFSQRKKKFSSRFLPVTVPFHSSYLTHVPEVLEQDILRHQLEFQSADLKIPVYHTHTGEDLRNTQKLTQSLIEQICVLSVQWEKATHLQDITHCLDFGPGGPSGVGSLVSRNKEGAGVAVILAGSISNNLHPDMSDKTAFFAQQLKYAPNWERDYRPKLVRIAGSSQVHIDTPFSRLIGKPPLMVAGMTPCTVNEGFVSAVTNAGYHVELAGGGQHTPQILDDRVKLLMERIPAGEGITLNILFLNPRLWGFQYPQSVEMRKRGIPMEGICVAAGVPSLDVASDVVTNLKDAGFRFVAFKPGSVETIRRVIAIAKQHPDFSIVLQWTGGRGGGHHSYEDLHQPMLETYASIRRVKNIVLVIGSGFGDGQETVPYLTGKWSNAFGYASMPFDGILFGSRVMVAEENLASPGVKDLIVQAPGITDEKMWERSYKGEIGGIITVKSELGEPIHKIANRGVRFWKEMDDTIFSLPKEKRLEQIHKKRDYIIKNLNENYQKPWFGQKENNQPCEIGEMTYRQVLGRIVELMFNRSKQEWIDPTYRDFFGDFLIRTEERFTRKAGNAFIESYQVLDQDPQLIVEAFAEHYPVSQVLTQEDVLYFLSLCAIPYRKPVPFIPVLDDRFEFWFKKDSLWQSENVDAVPDQDPQRVAILQGPVAVKHSTKIEPVKDILDNIYHYQIDAIKKEFYQNNDHLIPTAEYLGAKASDNVPDLRNIVISESFENKERLVSLELPTDVDLLPDETQFLDFLGSSQPCWARALLTSDYILQGKLLVSNPVKRIMKPRVNQTTFIGYDALGHPDIISVYERRSIQSRIPERQPTVVISKKDEYISVVLHDRHNNHDVPIEFKFKYVPSQGLNPIHEIMSDRNERIRQFYAALWSLPVQPVELTEQFVSKFVIDGKQVSDFVTFIGNNSELYQNKSEKHVSPLDFAIVVGWKSLVTALQPKEIDGDLLRLVHLSNAFNVLDASVDLCAGDEIESVGSINAVTISDSGKTIEVVCVLKKDGKPIVEILSQFLIRGIFTDYENTFRKTIEQPRQVIVQTKDIAVLESKKWAKLDQKLEAGAVLIFELETFARNKNLNAFSRVETKGKIMLKTNVETIQVGIVDHVDTDCQGNIVLEYLNRHGTPLVTEKYFENGGYSILPSESDLLNAPLDNHGYALASTDLNPIHVNPYFADLAQLPGTITHGMWTSASTRKFVELYAAENDPKRVKQYSVKFLGMVLPGDRLRTKLFHVGMANGCKLIKIETSSDRGLVLSGTAQVEQPVTAYVFTGQGSQHVGMGMDLYKSSEIAKQVWDRADQHALNKYGLSILKIVQENPKELTVHFGGRLGAAIRSSYRKMTYDIYENGKLKKIPIFPEIEEDSHSYTFYHPEGLLSATQFTQPCLTLTAMASYLDMKQNGLIQENAKFAGHSLGEYAALASLGQVLTVEAIMDVTFYRGMTMQVAVPRDAKGRSNYGMVAVNPLRVGQTLGEKGLEFVVSTIAKQVNGLLEIVNYNVENIQYVVAGDLFCLDVLRLVLNKIRSVNLNLGELLQTKTLEQVQEMLQELIQEMQQTTQKRLEEQKFLVPERGLATIPLQGIDVPFHSSFLSNGITTFRQVIMDRIDSRLLNLQLLQEKYIPNLTAQPFNISKAYFETVYKLTKSLLVEDILKQWPTLKLEDPQVQQQLGYKLLVELLAHQFAMPVRWIETQDQLFGTFQVERLIEVGPSPVLAGMAIRTLKLKYEAYDDAVTQRRTQYCTYKNRTEIYYEFEDPEPVQEVQAVEESAPVVVEQQQQVTVPVGKAQAVQDQPMTASDVLFVLIANKLKKPLDQIQGSKTIKDLVGGKSTLQNEILGELGAEFGNVAEKSEEVPLSEVAAQLQVSFSGALGKTSTQLINKMLSSKMPGGFGSAQVKSFLTSTFGLGPKRIDTVLLYSLLDEPQARLGSEQDAKQWLTKHGGAYCQREGISLEQKQTQQTSSVTVNSEDFLKMEKKVQAMIREQMQTSAKFLDFDLLEGAKTQEQKNQALEMIQTQLDLWALEHGEVYQSGIKPSFDRKKARVFNSHWNWAKQEALQLYYDCVFGKLTEVDRELMDRAIRLMNKSSKELVQEFEYYVNRITPEMGEGYQRAKTLGSVLLENCKQAVDTDPVFRNVHYRPTKPVTTIGADGYLQYHEELREEANLKDYVNAMRKGSHLTQVKNQIDPELIQKLIAECSRDELPQKIQELSQKQLPFLYLKRKAHETFEFDEELTNVYFDIMSKMSKDGISFKRKNCLMTGVGKDSIGVEVLKALLAGGAQVIATTSRFSRQVTEYYRGIFEQYGAKGAQLVVVPFNGGSHKDVQDIVDYIYDPKGLGWDLDFVIPFAAIPENGREIDSIDDKSELAHRIMLTNVMRLLGEIKTKKEKLGYTTRPAAVMLPLSPNHGTFGSDGLYGESKLGLETLVNRFFSESWGQYLTIIGAVIGWTRGTGLMSANNTVGQGIEELGARTFSTVEMAFNLIALLDPKLVSLSIQEPIWADLNGGLQFVKNLNVVTMNLRKELTESSQIKQNVIRDSQMDLKVLGKQEKPRLKTVPRSNFTFDFPKIKKMSHLNGLLDLDKTVVVTGFGEVGPFGGARTRWEMESNGEFSLEGCIEMAWIMNLIAYHHGPLKKMPFYSGWVDVETQEPVLDHEIKTKYEERILKHSGIRFIEPELFGGYDPKQKQFFQEISITEDLPPLDCSQEEAQQFKLKHGDKCCVEQKGDRYAVQILKGSTILVPKALRFDRLVAGQIPTGWSAKKYGIPDDIISQVDPITLYAIVATAEALITSGVSDPYEFYKYVHVSELGNSSGGGMGGMTALKKMFQDRRDEKPVQGDILQESFINTMPAWVNMLLLSSSGPIKTPVGACATAAESVDIAYETIISGKAKIMICGGYDDFHEEGSYEFANMKATSNSVTEMQMGREPKDMCRPCTDTRAGFMESQGAGIAVLMTGSLALQMGLPIRGIIASVNTATDKNGRSIPAPGQGILTTAREKKQASFVDLEFRRRQIEHEERSIKDWLQKELELLKDDPQRQIKMQYVEKQAEAKLKMAQQLWSHQLVSENVSPLRAGLQTFGLDMNDIGVASFHGTGTKANDYNESSVLNQQMEHLGRTKGNVLPTVFQKHLTGHPKGAAAAWMLNGVLQILETGIIPGNRNLDNVEQRLEKFQHLVYPSQTVQTDGIKAGLLKSFGFGQAGAEILVVHPDYLFASVSDQVFEDYLVKREQRQLQTYRYLHEMLTNTKPLVRVKTQAPYTDSQQAQVYLDPTCRAVYNDGSYHYDHKSFQKQSISPLAQFLESTDKVKGVGMDVQVIQDISMDPVFLERNLTPAEIEYCQSSPDPVSSVAGRWAAKEACIKAVSNATNESLWDSPGAPLKDIEIVRLPGQAPQVVFHGRAKQVVDRVGVQVKVTISHSGFYAAAAAVAQ
ncbi:hypothetical protein EDD86DRAFT_221808, partial [Gorgonomyces haynaldii]